MHKEQIIKDIKKALKELGYQKPEVILSIPEDSKFGDYSTNVALQLSKKASNNDKQSPRDIASNILEMMGHPIYLQRIDIAGPGFINFYLKEEALIKNLTEKASKADKENKGRILVEYAQPNTHKAFHIGHLRNISIGESVARLLEYQGVEVFRATYGGDIGPHVAKAIWGVMHDQEGYQKAKSASLKEKAEFLGHAYKLANQQYEASEQAKVEIDNLNIRIYQKDPELLSIWEETKSWSIGYFDSIYSRLGTEFDAEIWESEIEEAGRRMVQEYTGRVFIKDQGAVIFPGEKYGLHNRVFITTKGYPTYEAKELGLTLREEELFPLDKSLHVVANEQAEYFKVLNKALELIDESRKDKKQHLSHGMVNLTTGKMSSRKGQVITAEDLIDQVKVEMEEAGKKVADAIAIGAIKFSFLKYSLTSDIAFDIKQSVSLQGDSGPYLQYSFARTQSVLANSKESGELKGQISIDDVERDILRSLEHFEVISASAATNYAPSELCAYLLSLAKQFNSFYQDHPIIKSKEQIFRLALTKKVGEILKEGLYLLGIEAPERM